MRYVSIPLSENPISINSTSSNVYVHVYHIEKRPVIKVYLHHALTKIDVIYKDSEKIIIRASTRTDVTIFIITRNYIAELRNIINIYVLKNYEELELDKLTFDVDMEYECYNDDCDARFYLKIQETE
jgi:hypothetical protein